jgi:hypothetical protein
MMRERTVEERLVEVAEVEGFEGRLAKLAEILDAPGFFENKRTGMEYEWVDISTWNTGRVTVSTGDSSFVMKTDNLRFIPLSPGYAPSEEPS